MRLKLEKRSGATAVRVTQVLQVPVVFEKRRVVTVAGDRPVYRSEANTGWRGFGLKQDGSSMLHDLRHAGYLVNSRRAIWRRAAAQLDKVSGCTAPKTGTT